MKKMLNDQFSTEFARLLFTYRLNKKISLRRLATKLNISANTIGNYECGSTLPDSIEIVYTISKELGISLQSILSTIYRDLVNQNKLEFYDNTIFLQNNFSLFLTKKRNEKNMSQEELASLIGVSLEDIKGYESGQLIFDSITLAYKISLALDISFQTIINAKLKDVKETTSSPNMQYPSLVAKTLRIARTEVHLSQKNLAKISGFSKYSIICFETGKHKVNSIETAFKLAVALDLPLFSLVEARCIDLDNEK